MRENPTVSRLTPMGMRHETNPRESETGHETSVRRESLKALARKALQRDTSARQAVRLAPETVRQTRDEQGGFVSPVSHVRDRLLTIAREHGLPDRIVLDLPESELIATAEQHHDFTAEKGDELGRKLLVFYLRSLAGIEPALPGSLAERDAPARQARTLRDHHHKEPK